MRRLASAMLGLALVVIGVGPLSADPEIEGGRFDLRAIETRLVDDVYRLDAVGRLELSRRALEALNGGVALTIALEADIFRRRAWWLDQEVATVTQRHRLELHELSRQYIVTHLGTGERRGFYGVQSALDHIGRSLNFPVIDAVVIDEPARYYGRARMRLQREALPWALRPAAILYGDWRLQTDWVTWSFE